MQNSGGAECPRLRPLGGALGAAVSLELDRPGATCCGGPPKGRGRNGKPPPPLAHQAPQAGGAIGRRGAPPGRAPPSYCTSSSANMVPRFLPCPHASFVRTPHRASARAPPRGRGSSSLALVHLDRVVPSLRGAAGPAPSRSLVPRRPLTARSSARHSRRRRAAPAPRLLRRLGGRCGLVWVSACGILGLRLP